MVHWFPWAPSPVYTYMVALVSGATVQLGPLDSVRAVGPPGPRSLGPGALGLWALCTPEWPCRYFGFLEPKKLAKVGDFFLVTSIKNVTCEERI